MTFLDWLIVALYAAALVGVGLLQRKRAGADAEAYFASGRTLSWFLAGTSMIAASFASDTPLLVSGLARSKGIWGNWQWWGLGVSAVGLCFLFAPLWRRSGVLTEAELTELRYGGPSAAALRGFKAVYWGVLYNCYAAGALGVVGLSKVTQAVTGWDHAPCVIFCAVLAAAYAIVSGFWGVVATDLFQFCAAVFGSTALAYFAVDAAGGWGAVLAKVPAANLETIPRGAWGPSGTFWDSPLAWFLSFAAVQWWSYKNTDGGGMLVQRMVACRSERESTLATLWYCAAHYSLRAWPWIVVGLASMTLLPDLADAEMAYPQLILKVLPAGLRGFVLAWFFAEFVASLAGSMNWGASLLVNDLYRRFLRKDGSAAHYVRAGRLASALVMAGAVAAALCGTSIEKAFDTILLMTAGVGVVQMARWVWWRVNAWSEISAMVASPILVWLAPMAAGRLGIPEKSRLFGLLFVVAGSFGVWFSATLLTAPVGRAQLRAFYFKVRPPGPGWRGVARWIRPAVGPFPLGGILLDWVLGAAAIFSLNFAIGNALFRSAASGGAWTLAAAVSGFLLWRRLRDQD